MTCRRKQRTVQPIGCYRAHPGISLSTAWSEISVPLVEADVRERDVEATIDGIVQKNGWFPG
jgi:hypothetical protein